MATIGNMMWTDGRAPIWRCDVLDQPAGSTTRAVLKPNPINRALGVSLSRPRLQHWRKAEQARVAVNTALNEESTNGRRAWGSNKENGEAQNKVKDVKKESHAVDFEEKKPQCQSCHHMKDRRLHHGQSCATRRWKEERRFVAADGNEGC